MTKTTRGHSSKGHFKVTIHEEEYTHVSFGDGGIICSIADAFAIMDDMHKRPVMILRKGWEQHLRQMNPEHSPSWVKIERGGSWSNSRARTNENGLRMALAVGVGSRTPTIVATREFE